jgi:hypothetical protein
LADMYKCGGYNVKANPQKSGWCTIVFLWNVRWFIFLTWLWYWRFPLFHQVRFPTHGRLQIITYSWPGSGIEDFHWFTRSLRWMKSNSQARQNKIISSRMWTTDWRGEKLPITWCRQFKIWMVCHFVFRFGCFNYHTLFAL